MTAPAPEDVLIPQAYEYDNVEDAYAAGYHACFVYMRKLAPAPEVTAERVLMQRRLQSPTDLCENEWWPWEEVFGPDMTIRQPETYEYAWFERNAHPPKVVTVEPLPADMAEAIVPIEGPDDPDGPWAEGWEQRAGITAVTAEPDFWRWWTSEPYRLKYYADDPVCIAAREAWDAAHTHPPVQPTEPK